MTSSKSKYLVTTIVFMTDIIVRTMPALAKETTLLEIGGLLMLDYSQYDGIYISTHGDEDDFHIRRARVSLNHEYGDEWKFELDVKFDEETNSTRTLDAFIQYEGVEFMDFTVGQMKEPFGLEKLTASKNGTFLERSTITGAAAPGRNCPGPSGTESLTSTNLEAYSSLSGYRGQKSSETSISTRIARLSVMLLCSI